MTMKAILVHAGRRQWGDLSCDLFMTQVGEDAVFLSPPWATFPPRCPLDRSQHPHFCVPPYCPHTSFFPPFGLYLLVLITSNHPQSWAIHFHPPQTILPLYRLSLSDVGDCSLISTYKLLDSLWYSCYFTSLDNAVIASRYLVIAQQ